MSMQEPLYAAILNGAGRPQSGICTAAFSGGADSTALLHALYMLRDELQIDLRAVHVHHGIRGAEADRDAAFCAAFCEQYGIPFQLVRVDVPAYAREQKLSEETAARRLRYDALEQAAPVGEIAAAHHADDLAETVLFHLLRGSGLKGLRGILPRSGRLIRPILTVGKQEILSYLSRNALQYVEDSTNFSDACSRNRLRADIMPLLVRENPAAVQHICRTAAMLAEDEAFLAEIGAEAYAACFDPRSGGLHHLAQYPRPVRMRVYMKRLEQLSRSRQIDPSCAMLAAIDEAVLQGSGTVNLSANVYARVDRGILYMQRKPLPPLCSSLPMQPGENRFYPEKSCFAAVYDASALSKNSHNADTKATLDFDKIIGKPFFRQYTNSDRIQLPARDFSSLLKKCIQAAVPAPERKTLYALYDDLGCIFCEQVGIAARVKPDANSRRILMLSVRAAEIPTTDKE